jgi:hypothetical protein
VTGYTISAKAMRLKDPVLVEVAVDQLEAIGSRAGGNGTATAAVLQGWVQYTLNHRELPAGYYSFQVRALTFDMKGEWSDGTLPLIPITGVAKNPGGINGSLVGIPKPGKPQGCTATVLPNGR